MWLSAISVILVSWTVSSVVSVTNFEDNHIIQEDFLQELPSRTKKSPAEDKESTDNGYTNSEFTSDITTSNLKTTKSGYKKIFSDNLSSIHQDNSRPSSTEKNNSQLLNYEGKVSHDTKPLVEDEPVESFRNPRQFHSDGYMIDTFNEQRLPDAGFQNIHHDPIHVDDNSGSSYILPVSSSLRTYEDDSIQGNIDKGAESGFHGETSVKPGLHGVNSVKPLKELKKLIPTVVSALAAATSSLQPATAPVAGQSGHGIKKPIKHKKITHKPLDIHKIEKPKIEIHKIKPESKFPLLPGKKGLKHPGMFFSKQIIFGIGADHQFGGKPHFQTIIPEGHSYYPPNFSFYPQEHYVYEPTFYAYPEGHSYIDPTYSLYPQGHAYIAPNFSLYPEEGTYYIPVGSYPEIQTDYGSTFTSFPQGHAYFDPSTTYTQRESNSSDSSYRHTMNGQNKPYQEEPSHKIINQNILTPQVFKSAESEDSLKSLDKTKSYLNLEQLRSYIEEEQKRIEDLEVQLKTTAINVKSLEHVRPVIKR